MPLIEKIALKPCPFCGGEAVLVAEPGDADETGPLAFVYCHKCGASTEREEYDADAIAAWNNRAALTAIMDAGDGVQEVFYIDCEFDGHGGPLISMAIVHQGGRSAHITVTDHPAVQDQWVVDNVVSVLASTPSGHNINLPLLAVGPFLRLFMGEAKCPTIIADSPVDIGRFCAALSTSSDGGWASTDYPGMTFEVHNVDCYPTELEGAVQHSAWWDAMALRAKVSARHRSTAAAAERARRDDGWQFARSVLHQIADGEATQVDIEQWLEDAEKALADAIERGEV